jgi:acetylornithine deacetylase
MTSEQERVVELASDLMAIPSVTGDETAAGAWLAERCEALGLKTEVQEVQPGRNNVVATLPGGDGPRLLLTGHMDVVPPGEGWDGDPFKPRVESGRLIGRGAADMKGGLAAMLVAIENVAADQRQRASDIVFAAVVGEEEDQIGTATLIDQGFTADFAVVGEPTDNKVIRGHKGCVAYRISIRGQAAHASTPHAGVNAVEQAADIVGELRAVAAQLRDSPHPAFGSGTLTVGTINGGTRPYIVPDRCELEVDRRLIPGETVDTSVDEAHAAIGAARARWKDIDYDVTVEAGALPFELPPDHELVQAAMAAMTSIGQPAELALWDAVSDASILVNDGGIPTIILGPGSIADSAHRPNEYVPIAELAATQRAYERLLRDRMGWSHSG